MAGLVLGIDTCGPSGSAALARIGPGGIEVLDQTHLAGRSYSATLIAAVGELLERAQADFGQVRTIVIVNGPGSFTGVRVGVSAAKGLAEGREIGVVPVSRLEVLAAKAGVAAAALDAHRGEVFLRVGEVGGASMESLAGKDELTAIESRSNETRPAKIAVCDETAAALLRNAWPSVEPVCVEAPTAADAIALCAPRMAAGGFADLALLDGHYLRRPDAEIGAEIFSAKICGDSGARAKDA